MAGVVSRYGETGKVPYLLPLSVDGLVIVASISLVELSGRIYSVERLAADPLVPTHGSMDSTDVPTRADRTARPDRANATSAGVGGNHTTESGNDPYNLPQTASQTIKHSLPAHRTLGLAEPTADSDGIVDEAPNAGNDQLPAPTDPADTGGTGLTAPSATAPASPPTRTDINAEQQPTRQESRGRGPSRTSDHDDGA